MSLYDMLGIRPDASGADIHKAFRKKAKTAHPDAGGSAEEFAQIEKAARILSDPAKRLTYDRTGQCEEPTPDNETALALGMIQEMVNAAIKGDIPPGMNMLSAMKDEALRHQQQAKAANTELSRRIGRLDKLARRFKAKAGENLIGRMIEAQAQEFRAGMAVNEQRLGVLAQVMAILDGYEFEVEVEAAPAPPRINPYAAAMGGIGLGPGLGAFG